jgi:hypothetical protein
MNALDRYSAGASYRQVIHNVGQLGIQLLFGHVRGGACITLTGNRWFPEGEAKMRPRKVNPFEHPFDAVAQMEVVQGEAKLMIMKEFIDYLADLPKKEKDKIIAQLVEQKIESREMRSETDHPFYGDERGFTQYCKVKYKLLYEHIVQVINTFG